MLLADGTYAGETGAVMAQKLSQATGDHLVQHGRDRDSRCGSRDAGGKAIDKIEALPDGRKVVYVEDPAGNIFGLTQSPR